MGIGRRKVVQALAVAPLFPRIAAGAPRIATDWTTAAPGTLGLDPALLAQAADRLDAAGERQGLVIVRDGRLVFERYWANVYHTASRAFRNVTFSAGKSWGATMVGRAVTQKRLAVDDLAARYVPAQQTGLRPDTTIRHLLTMTSGGTAMVKPSSRPPRRLDAAAAAGTPDKYRRRDDHAGVRGAPAGYADTLPPGQTFFYDGAAVDHLAEIVSAATGRPSYDYMMAEVVRAIGCRHADYQPEGIDSDRDIRIGGSMLISCRDLARLGQLYLDNGSWNGRALVDASFIRAAISPSPRNPDYGYLWWLNTTGKIDAPRTLYFAAGARGQFCFVLPDTRTIVATMGFGAEELTVAQAWDALRPALL